MNLAIYNDKHYLLKKMLILCLPKVVAAERHLKALRHDLKLNTFITHVDYYFLDKYAKHVDLIIDATDNFETRQLINDFAFKEKVPWIYGGVVQSTYIEAAFIPVETPCFNCFNASTTSN